MEEMYLTNHVLRGEKNTMPPMRNQKKGLIQSFLDMLTNIGGSIPRLPNSFLSRMNSPLSVTVVDNENIIAYELFRNSLENTRPSDKTYSSNIKENNHLDIMRKECNIVLETKKSQIADQLDQLAKTQMKIDSYDHDSIVEIDWDNEDTRMIAKKENLARENTRLDITREDNSAVESLSLSSGDKTETSYMIDNSCTMEVGPRKFRDENMLYNESDSIFNNVDEDVSIDIESFHIVCDSDVPPKAVDPIEKSTSALSSDVDTWTGCGLYSKWNKMWHSATDRLYRKTDAFESEIPTKRPYLLKQRRKANTAATGRGRGRAKCQLRRSGVSQTRHRKNRTKHGLVMNIEDNQGTGQDVEMYHTVQDDYSSDSNSLDDIDDYDVMDGDFIGQIASSPVKFTISDILPNEDKPKTCDNKIKEPAVDFHKNYIDKIHNFRGNSSRLRVISECSIDSDDSFCIIFDVEPDENSRIDDNSTSINSTSFETENDENEFTTQKVRFNPIPIVHNMVQWDYAYRAARKGPWEEMARDRERFRGRINCIASVLNPILTRQHRTNIWQERFAQQE